MDSALREKVIIHTMALTLVEGVGPVTAKRLVAFCGGADEVFDESKKELIAIPGIGEYLAATVKKNAAMALKAAEKEYNWLCKNEIVPILFNDVSYPNRLRYCDDGPLVLFTRGEMNMQHPRMLSIVGTRKPTDYGKRVCEEIVSALAPYNVVVVSGMAYGIDILAHQVCLQHGIETIGVLAHGLDRIYPQVHTSIARKMENRGGVVTEFMSGCEPDHQNFPKRNRIVAGMCDATLVIETAIKGGSMITAELANDYSRDVFAIPGAVDMELSRGCNFLIRSQRAHLAESVTDIVRVMGWDHVLISKPVVQQPELFMDLGPDEKKVFSVLMEKGKSMIDHIALQAQLPVSQTGVHLLNLEFKGLVRSLPGKVYEAK